MAAALLLFPLLTHHIDDQALLPDHFQNYEIFAEAEISKIFKVTFQPTARSHLFSWAMRTESCKPEVDRLPYKEVKVKFFN
jgi:hypothetical protein